VGCSLLGSQVPHSGRWPQSAQSLLLPHSARIAARQGKASMTWGDFVAICIVVWFLSSFFDREEKSVSTIDDTATDIEALNEFINGLPDVMQDAVANGTLSLTIDWVEITRDEDDYPTIKPRVVFTSTGGKKNGFFGPPPIT
jgi:hypothetical protein